ncbi:MAG: uroporphyrinogen decarboxylase family protein, partial [Spirochaetales bacterium]
GMGNKNIHLVPVVYEHAAAFVGKTPWEVAYNSKLLAKAHEAAWKEYHHPSITVGIDVYNLEAECYGAKVERPEGMEVPSIKEYPYQSCEEISQLPFFDPEKAGRFPLIFEAAETLRKTLGDIDLRVPLGGPFSIASNLIGFENLLIETISDPATVKSTLIHLAEGQLHIARAGKERGFGVTFFESAATPPLLSPELFREVELPALQVVMEGTAAMYSERPVFIMGGDTLPVLPDVLACKPSFIICPGETDQVAFMDYMKAHREVRVRINMVVEIVAHGSEEELWQECKRVFEIAKDFDPLLIGTGVLPYNVSPSRVHLLEQFVKELL